STAPGEPACRSGSGPTPERPTSSPASSPWSPAAASRRTATQTSNTSSTCCGGGCTSGWTARSTRWRRGRPSSCRRAPPIGMRTGATSRWSFCASFRRRRSTPPNGWSEAGVRAGSNAGFEIQGVHHWSVNVTDLGRADAFYTEVLGLKKIPRPDLLVDGVWYELPDGRQVHLIVRPEAGSLRGTTRIDSREAHLALAVRDWE